MSIFAICKVEKEELTLRTLTTEEAEKLQHAIFNHYWYQVGMAITLTVNNLA